MKHDVTKHEIFNKHDIHLNIILMPCLPRKNQLTLRGKKPITATTFFAV
jgi:hypothetical protein